MRTVLLCLLALVILMPTTAFADTLSDTKLPNKIKVGGTDLVLNGKGLREKWTFDVYVGGLYLPSKTKDGNKAINDDVAKRVIMHFVRDLDADKLKETLGESLTKQKIASAKVNKLKSWLKPVKDGDAIIIDYEPNKGTTFKLKVKGGKTEKMGTIKGIDFMKALLSTFVGANPADKDLKKGMLGK